MEEKWKRTRFNKLFNDSVIIEIIIPVPKYSFIKFVNDKTRLESIIGTEDNSRTADLIFVHGLGGNALSTWHPQNKQEKQNSWLTWLGEDLKNVGVWSLGYEVEPFKFKGNTMPLSDRATNIIDLLDNYDIGEKPLVFVTHSMGGLLVKQLLRHANDFGNSSWRRMVEQTKGIIFLSTPHSGSDIANWLKYIGGILGASISVKELEANDSRLLELNEVYRNHEVLSQIPIKVYCETERTNGIIVVDRTSANPGIKGATPVPLAKNHISIAKPKSRADSLYMGVRKFIKEQLASARPIPPLNNTSKTSPAERVINIQTPESKKKA